MLVRENARLLDALAGMSRVKRVAFCVLIIERLFPYLLAFTASEGLDDSPFVRAKTALWQALTRDIDAAMLGDLIQQCVDRAPDSEDYPDISVADALNGALALVFTLEFLKSGDLEKVVDTAQLIVDSVDGYLGSLSASIVLTNEEAAAIDRHPLMRSEIRRQMDDIELLSKLPQQFSESEVSLLRARASEAPLLLPAPRMERLH